MPMRADMLASEARAARWRKNGFKRKRERKKGYKMHAATTDVKRKADPAANSYIRDCEREHTGPHLQRYAVALYGGKQRRSCNCRHARHKAESPGRASKRSHPKSNDRRETKRYKQMNKTQMR